MIRTGTLELTMVEAELLRDALDQWGRNVQVVHSEGSKPVYELARKFVERRIIEMRERIEKLMKEMEGGPTLRSGLTIPLDNLSDGVVMIGGTRVEVKSGVVKADDVPGFLPPDQVQTEPKRKHRAEPVNGNGKVHTIKGPDDKDGDTPVLGVREEIIRVMNAVSPDMMLTAKEIYNVGEFENEAVVYSDLSKMTLRHKWLTRTKSESGAYQYQIDRSAIPAELLAGAQT